MGCTNCVEPHKPAPCCVGEKGDKGDTGPMGQKGNTGDKGDTGAKGDIGAQGPKGDTGATGEKGDTGAQGPKGDTGAKGDTGSRGPAGADGSAGTGLQGPKGDKGDTGAQGPAGSNGSAGEPTLMTFPMFGGRAGTINATNQGTKAAFNTFINASGGFTNTLGSTDITIPKDGWYRFDHRATARYISAPVPNCKIATFKNGVAMPTLGIDFGTNFFPYVAVNDQVEAEKSMYHFCNAGDVITVIANLMGQGAEWMAETFLIKWESAS